MKFRDEIYGALTVTATALGIDFVSGRALVMFYAQTGRASWLGVFLSALLFGLGVGGIAHLVRRSGARNLPELFDRMPGRGLGNGFRLLYGLIVLMAAGILLSSAGKMGGLMLPMRRAELAGAGAALLAAWIAARAGENRRKAMAGALILLLLVFELALLFAKLPETPRYEIELRLRDNYAAAVILALIHASVCLCLCAGTAAKAAGRRTRPAYLGIWAGVQFGLLAALGNAVLTVGEERLLALQLPFVALSAAWQGVGFFLCAALNWLFSAASMAGLIHGFLPGKTARIHSENDVKL